MIFCAVGGRASVAKRCLEEMGYKNVSVSACIDSSGSIHHLFYISSANDKLNTNQFLAVLLPFLFAKVLNAGGLCDLDHIQ